MDDYVVLFDRSVKELGITRAYFLALIGRYSQSDPPAAVNIPELAGKVRLSPNTVRQVVKSLLQGGYISDLTPDLINKPHVYRPTERGMKLLVTGKAGRPEPKNRRRRKQVDQRGSIGHDSQMRPGGLDIEAYRHLNRLGIRPDIRQTFKTAPDLVKRYTPAQILMLHDPNGEIAANLAAWRAAAEAGVELRDRPALIWTRIVEGQPPPQRPEPVGEEDRPMSELLAEQRPFQNWMADHVAQGYSISEARSMWFEQYNDPEGSAEG